MEAVGVDGCPGGWVAIAYDTAAGTLVPRVHPYFAELLAAYPDAACIGVDIPSASRRALLGSATSRPGASSARGGRASSPRPTPG